MFRIRHKSSRLVANAQDLRQLENGSGKCEEAE